MSNFKIESGNLYPNREQEIKFENVQLKFH